MRVHICEKCGVDNSTEICDVLRDSTGCRSGCQAVELNQDPSIRAWQLIGAGGLGQVGAGSVCLQVGL